MTQEGNTRLIEERIIDQDIDRANSVFWKSLNEQHEEFQDSAAALLTPGEEADVTDTYKVALAGVLAEINLALANNNPEMLEALSVVYSMSFSGTKAIEVSAIFLNKSVGAESESAAAFMHLVSVVAGLYLPDRDLNVELGKADVEVLEQGVFRRQRVLDSIFTTNLTEVDRGYYETYLLALQYAYASFLESIHNGVDAPDKWSALLSPTNNASKVIELARFLVQDASGVALIIKPEEAKAVHGLAIRLLEQSKPLFLQAQDQYKQIISGGLIRILTPSFWNLNEKADYEDKNQLVFAKLVDVFRDILSDEEVSQEKVAKLKLLLTRERKVATSLRELVGMLIKGDQLDEYTEMIDFLVNGDDTVAEIIKSRGGLPEQDPLYAVSKMEKIINIASMSTLLNTWRVILDNPIRLEEQLDVIKKFMRGDLTQSLPIIWELEEWYKGYERENFDEWYQHFEQGNPNDSLQRSTAFRNLGRLLELLVLRTEN